MLFRALLANLYRLVHRLCDIRDGIKRILQRIGIMANLYQHAVFAYLLIIAPCADARRFAKPFGISVQLAC